MKYTLYSKKGETEFTPWVKGFDMKGVVVSPAEVKGGSPKKGDMIARNKDNHEDRWLVAKKYFGDNYAPTKLTVAGAKAETSGKKTLKNTDSSAASKNVKDLVVWGNGDLFKLLGKAHSEAEGWMKSTKGMEIPGGGVVIQVTTQNKDNVAEAAVFVPNVIIKEVMDKKGKVVSRKLVRQA